MSESIQQSREPQHSISLQIAYQIGDSIEKGFDWMVATCRQQQRQCLFDAEHELAIFTFADHSRLALLQNGNLYATNSSSAKNNESVKSWLLAQGVASAEAVMARLAAQDASHHRWSVNAAPKLSPPSAAALVPKPCHNHSSCQGWCVTPTEIECGCCVACYVEPFAEMHDMQEAGIQMPGAYLDLLESLHLGKLDPAVTAVARQLYEDNWPNIDEPRPDVCIGAASVRSMLTSIGWDIERLRVAPDAQARSWLHGSIYTQVSFMLTSGMIEQWEWMALTNRINGAIGLDPIWTPEQIAQFMPSTVAAE